MSTPRELVLLRVDDKLPPTAPPLASGSVQAGHQPPPGIELMTFEESGTEYLGIDGWERSVRYWLSFNRRNLPDLVVADVRFDRDHTSPLNFDAMHSSIPTGLSHLKPIAAVARAAGRPLGIALHTEDVDLWGKLVRQMDPMGFLAAHEIGELAAILRESVLVEGIPEKEARLGACWRWLRENTAPGFGSAFNIALRNFRRHILLTANEQPPGVRREITVLPQEYVALLNWCEQKSGSGSARVADLGLGYVCDDGASDRVSFRSLFADSVVDFAQLPSACFEIPAARGGELLGERPWALADGHPRIGAFIAAVGSLAEASKTAGEVVELFPLDPSSSEAAPRLITSGEVPLVRGLVVLYQVLRRDHHNFARWLEYCKRLGWNPRKCRLEDSCAPSLRRYLTTVNATLRSGEADGDEWLYVADVAEGLEVSRKAAQWHLDVLLLAGVAEQSTDEAAVPVFRSVHETVRHLPIPPIPPCDLDILRGGAKSFLQESLGVPKNNHNQIGLVLDAAFVKEPGSVNDQAKAGRLFLDRFLDGKAAPWLMEVCRDYAVRGLEWGETETWPRPIRVTAEE